MAQEPLPDKYFELSEAEIDRQTGEAKATLGPSLVILGHHYQRDSIIKFADYRGDSFKLSQFAANRKDANFIVFCGVHFMAESADILSADYQKVILPDLDAGCSMADMAEIGEVEECWDTITKLSDDGIVPVTYMNSAANLKAFCGEHGGAVCTSSNAGAVFRWAFERGEKLLFFPDEHLGRNTVAKLGLSLDRTAVWDPLEALGGNDEERLSKSKVVLWKGYCSVHQQFTPQQIKKVRESYPGIKVIVHPECTREVVELSDDDGSTEYIIKKVTESPSGSKWAIGTEINLVGRLAKENPDKFIICLNEIVCVCTTMFRIDPPHLLWSLDNLLAGKVINQITVPEDVARWARIALDRMLEIK